MGARIRPLSDRVVIRELAAPATSTGGIHLAPSKQTEKERAIEGIVVAVGQRELEDGTRVPLGVTVGEHVVVGGHAQYREHQRVRIGDEPFVIVREGQIAGVFDPEAPAR